MISVRRRLLIGLLALVLAVDGVAGFLSYRRALISTDTLLDYQLRQMALSLRDQGAAIPDISIPDSDFDFAIQIWDKGGASIYSSPTDQPLAHDAPLGYTDLTIGGARWRGFALQTSQRVILVAQPSGVRERLAGGIALRALAPLLILTPLLALAIWWMVVRTLAPIRRVVGEVQRRDADSLSPLMTTDLPREIAPLISELNRLLERLGAAFKAQRALISDAAHELRSPLTVLRLQLQLLGRAPDELARGEALERLTEAMERAGNLVQQLLILARNDPGAASALPAPLSLDAVLRDGVADCASLAVSRGIDLALEVDSSIRMVGDADSLRILVRNLVDNAIRYTPAGGHVLVKLRDTGDAARFDVEDSGPGIHPDDHIRVFDRFYRGSDINEPGSGLGLAIVKAIVERHEGRILLDRSEWGGLKVSVFFAATRQAPASIP